MHPKYLDLIPQHYLNLTEQWLLDVVNKPELHDAAVVFSLWFDRAHLRDRHNSLRMERLYRNTKTNAADDADQARKGIRAAIVCLAVSMGSAFWAYIGNSRSLRDYMSKQASRRIHVHEAEGDPNR